MAEPQQQSKPATPEFLLDEADLLTAEDKAALEAEQAGEPEAPPEGLPAKLPEQPAQQTTPESTEKAARKQKPSEWVPYDRLEKTAERARKAEEDLAAMREERARLDERLKMAREADERARQQVLAKPVEVPTKLGGRPDPAIDPIGADLWDARREAEVARYEAAEAKAGNTEISAQVAANREQQQFANWVNDDAQRFRAQHPDYDAAADHVYTFRVQWWRDLGLTEEAAKQIVDQEAVASAMLARQNGKSAASGFYTFAQKIGYQGNGAQPAAAAEPEVQPSPTQQARERLNQVREGQKFQGLSRVPAENPANVDWSSMTAQDLANMPEDQFVDLNNDPVKGPQLRRLMERLELGQ